MGVGTRSFIKAVEFVNTKKVPGFHAIRMKNGSFPAGLTSEYGQFFVEPRANFGRWSRALRATGTAYMLSLVMKAHADFCFVCIYNQHVYDPLHGATVPFSLDGLDNVCRRFGGAGTAFANVGRIYYISGARKSTKQRKRKRKRQSQPRGRPPRPKPMG